MVRILVKKNPSGQISTLVPIKQETVRKRQEIQKCPSVGSSLNYSSFWSWLENHFLNEVIFISTSICLRTARLILKKNLDDKPIFHLEILQHITEGFPISR
jgi:hypothetical protein